jgi:hypothetical protein
MEKKFYIINDAFKKGAIKIQSKAKYNTFDVLREGSPLKSENTFYIDCGKKLFDIIRFSDSPNIAISKKVKAILEESGFTGWGSFPIKIEGVLEEYYAFQVLSKAGPILNLEAVNNYETEFSEFDINTWDGSDIFNLEATLLKVCTQKVKDALEAAKITNLEIRPL